MKKGTTAHWVKDGVLEIRKARGKLTVDEIEEVLLYGHDAGGCQLHGHYAMIFRCAEEQCGGNGLWDMGAQECKGDVAQLHILYDSNDCPVCNSMLPPITCCPNCGETWKKEDKT